MYKYRNNEAAWISINSREIEPQKLKLDIPGDAAVSQLLHWSNVKIKHNGHSYTVLQPCILYVYFNIIPGPNKNKLKLL